MSPISSPRPDLLLFAAALVFLAAALVRQVAVAAPLGPDEAIYASGGRELLSGTPASGYGLHRPVGMKVLAAAGLQLGSSEWALRSFVVVCSLGFLVAYRAFGARAFGVWPATWAAAAMVTSFGLQRRGGEILSDVPSLLLMILTLFVLAAELEPPAEDARPGIALLAAAPLAAAVFYLRYGLATSLLGVALAACAVWWRRLAAARGLALATAGLFLLLLVPHIIDSARQTGSALGILEVSGETAHRAFLGEGLLQFPLVLLLEGGPVLAALVIGGAVHGARRLRRPPTDARGRATRFVWLASVFHILATGLLVHAEFRYFFFGVAGLALIGAAAAFQAVAHPRRLSVIAGLAILSTAALTHEFNINRYTRLERTRQVEVAAGELVRRAAGTGSCVALTSEVPVIGWYSGCAARPLTAHADRLAEDRRFLVLFSRDPESARVRARLARSHRLTPVGRAPDPAKYFGDAEVYDIR